MQILQYSEGRWIVEGSKGKEYHVKRWMSEGCATLGIPVAYSWACDCPGSIYRGHCRHIEVVRIATSEDKS